MPIEVAERAKPERAAYGTTEAALLLGCSRGHIYNLADRGVLRLVKLGRRTLVPASEIRRLLETDVRG